MPSGQSQAQPVSSQVYSPGDNLVVQGIPAIPQSLVEATRRYADNRRATFGGWHPVKREMLIATRFGETDQVHLVEFPGGARRQLTFYSDATSPQGFVPAHNDSFLFQKDKGGDEQFQTYRHDLVTGYVTLLTDGKSRNSGPVRSNHGSRVAYLSNRRNGDDMDLWLVDAANPQTGHMVTQVKGAGWTILDWSPDDNRLLISEDIAADDANLLLVNPSTGETSVLAVKPPGVREVYNNAKFSKDGKGIYVTTDRHSEFQRLAYFDLGTKQISCLSAHLDFDIEEFDLSWDGKMIAFVANEEGLGVLHIIDTRTKKELQVPKLPVGIVSGLSWHRNNRDLAFNFQSSRAPSDVYSLDVRRGKIERWTYSESGGLDAYAFSAAELIHWKTWDGRVISGFLYRPPSKFVGKRPVMVIIHGGPEDQSRPGFLARTNYYSNELGIALVFPNIRGSTGYGKSFVDLDNGRLREGALKDIGALFDWIGNQSALDASRVAVAGVSYGGFMTLWAAASYNDRIRCAVDVSGPSSLVTLLNSMTGYRKDRRRLEYGDESDPKTREFLERIAPANNSATISKPLLVIQGYNDPRVPRAEAEQIVTHLRDQQTPVWYLMAKDEGHGFEKKTNRDFEFYSEVLFVEKYLLGMSEAMPSP